MRSFLFLILLIGLAAGAYAQTGSLSGTVTDEEGNPVKAVSIHILHTHLNTLTDEQGIYHLKNVPSGDQVVEASSLGLADEQKQLRIIAGRTSTLHFQMRPESHQLGAVTVNGIRNKFTDKKSDYVAKLPLANLENPQVYNVIPEALLEEQMVTNLGDALKNAPGVNKLWSSTGRPGDGAGYFSMRGFSVQPTMVNGIAVPTNSTVDAANIERIEAIKGPSGTLYGSSMISFGGLINIVTKKPYDSLGGAAGYTMGSYNLNRVTLDLNTPLSASKKALLRVNGAYNYQGSFQDAGFEKHFFVAPVFSFKVNDRLDFLLNTEFYSGKATNPLMVFLNRSRPLIARTPKELGMDFNRSYTSNDLYTQNNSFSFNGQMRYRLSDAWTSQTHVSRGTRIAKGYYSYVMFLEPDNDTLITRYITKQNYTNVTTDIQQNFVGDFRIAGLRNRMIVGLDYLNLQTHDNGAGWIAFDKINVQRKDDPRYSEISQVAVDRKLAENASPNRSGSKNSTYSIYASDVLNLTDRLNVMLSLRLDRFENDGNYNYRKDTVTGKYGQTALSPKFGLVYQLVKDHVSLFGNYMNGFKNVAPVSQPLADIPGTFKPQSVNQVEGGIKVAAFHHALNLTASYYSILLDNALRSETINREGKSYNITVQDGSQRSRGIEVELITTPVQGLNIIAGYSYNDSKALKTTPDYEGRRPVTAGPASLANTWISYTLISGKAKGLGFGLGGNYASENKITNNKTTGIFTIPSYAVFNAAVFYNADKWRIGLKLNNLTDKEYFTGWTTVEKKMPRNFMANVTFKF